MLVNQPEYSTQGWLISGFGVKLSFHTRHSECLLLKSHASMYCIRSVILNVFVPVTRYCRGEYLVLCGRKLQWSSRLPRTEDTCIPQRATNRTPTEVMQKRGHQRTSWWNTVNEDLRATGAALGRSDPDGQWQEAVEVPYRPMCHLHEDGPGTL